METSTRYRLVMVTAPVAVAEGSHDYLDWLAEGLRPGCD